MGSVPIGASTARPTAAAGAPPCGVILSTAALAETCVPQRRRTAVREHVSARARCAAGYVSMSCPTLAIAAVVARHAHWGMSVPAAFAVTQRSLTVLDTE